MRINLIVCIALSTIVCSSPSKLQHDSVLSAQDYKIISYLIDSLLERIPNEKTVFFDAARTNTILMSTASPKCIGKRPLGQLVREFREVNGKSFGILLDSLADKLNRRVEVVQDANSFPLIKINRPMHACVEAAIYSLITVDFMITPLAGGQHIFLIKSQDSVIEVVCSEEVRRY